MRRAVLCLLLAISVGLQGIAWAGQILGGDRNGDTAHSVLHADGVSHHHEHDGSVKKDTSQKSKQHVQSEGCASLAMIPPPDVGAVGTWVASSGRADTPSQGYDSPFLEGLKRPPR